MLNHIVKYDLPFNSEFIAIARSPYNKVYIVVNNTDKAKQSMYKDRTFSTHEVDINGNCHYGHYDLTHKQALADLNRRVSGN